MNILRLLGRLGKAMLGLSFVSFTVAPLLSLVGIAPTGPIGDVVETARLILILTLIATVAIVGITGFLGYFILTGWKSYHVIPKLMRLVLGFMLGASAFILSGPIGILIPIPILPAVITAIAMWALLRWVSNSLAGPTAASRLPVARLIEVARTGAQNLCPKHGDLDFHEAEAEGRVWNFKFQLRGSSNRILVKVDSISGEIVKCSFL